MAFSAIDEYKTDVYFGNGILTKEKDAKFNAEVILKPAIIEKFGLDYYQKHIGKVDYAYNSTHLAGIHDLIESLFQKLIPKPNKKRTKHSVVTAARPAGASRMKAGRKSCLNPQGSEAVHDFQAFVDVPKGTEHLSSEDDGRVFRSHLGSVLFIKVIKPRSTWKFRGIRGKSLPFLTFLTPLSFTFH